MEDSFPVEGGRILLVLQYPAQRVNTALDQNPSENFVLLKMLSSGNSFLNQTVEVPRKSRSESFGLRNSQELGRPGGSVVESAFSPGRDPGDPGSSPTSASLCGACFSLCLGLCLSLCLSRINKIFKNK